MYDITGQNGVTTAFPKEQTNYGCWVGKGRKHDGIGDRGPEIGVWGLAVRGRLGVN